MRVSLFIRHLLVALFAQASITIATGGTTTVQVYNADDMLEASSILGQDPYELILHDDIILKASKTGRTWTNEKHLYYDTDITIKSAEGSNYSVSFEGGSRSGLQEAFDKCNMLFENLHNVTFKYFMDIACYKDRVDLGDSELSDGYDAETGALIRSYKAIFRDLTGKFTMEDIYLTADSMGSYQMFANDAEVSGVGIDSGNIEWVNIADGVKISNIRVVDEVDALVDWQRYIVMEGIAVNTGDLTVKDNGCSVVFSNNYVEQVFTDGMEGEAAGAALYMFGEGLFSNNAGTLEFSSNYLKMATCAAGAAIFITDASNLTITGQHDDETAGVAASISFIKNGAELLYNDGSKINRDSYAYGGAISIGYDNESYASDPSSTLSIIDNECDVIFRDNYLDFYFYEAPRIDDNNVYVYGGAIYVNFDSSLTISNNHGVDFSSNFVWLNYAETNDDTDRIAAGGALYLGKNASALFSENSEGVKFVGNDASAIGMDAYAMGGAIAMHDGSSLEFSDNEKGSFNAGVLFEANVSNQKGGAIYLGNDATLELKNNQLVHFLANQATEGGALYACTGSVMTVNDRVLFSENKAQSGGALFVNGSLSITGESVMMEFVGNEAESSGGAITVAEGASLNIFGNISGNDVDLFFHENSAGDHGGSVYALGNLTISNIQVGQILFSDNRDSTLGGAIYGASTLEFAENAAAAALRFEENRADAGGAIYHEGGQNAAVRFFKNSGEIIFSSNQAERQGGAIASYAPVIFEANTGLVSFADNIAHSGAAISATELDFCSNSGVFKFINNASDSVGGAIDMQRGTFRSNEANIIFAGNRGLQGGAIGGGDVSFSSNIGDVAFILNVAGRAQNAVADGICAGGALCISDASGSGNLSIDANGGRVLFFANRAENAGAMGGAIYGANSTLSLRDNTGQLIFQANQSAGSGGAIAIQNATLDIVKNQSVEFFGNSAAERGGAIASYADSTVRIHDNGKVSFVDNSAAYASAIYSEGVLSIRNNENVLFSGNGAAAVHLLIDTTKSYSNPAHLSLSAAEDKSILFDGTGIRTERSVGSARILIDLNADYTDGNLPQTGDIVFRGAGSKSELFSSTVTLHNGSLMLQQQSKMLVDGQYVNHANTIISDGASFTVDAINGEANSFLQVSDSFVRTQNINLILAKARFENSVLQNQNGALNDAVVRVDSQSVLTLAGGNTFDGTIALRNGGELSLSGHNVLNGTLEAASGTSLLRFSIQDASNLLLSTNTAVDVAQLRAEGISWNESSPEGAHELELNVDARAAGGTYVLLSLEKGITNRDISWSENWSTPENVYWLDDYTLVYKHEVDDLVWMNGEQTYVWDFSDANWQKWSDGRPDGSDVSFLNGGDVYFTDACQASDAVVLKEDVFMEKMTVSASRDYEFVSIGGKITLDTVLVKEGSGTLTINFDNDFVGGVELKGGTIHVGADYALGKGKITSEEDSLLEIGSGVHARIEHGDSTLRGAVALADDAIVEFGGKFLSSELKSLSGNGKLIVSAPKAVLAVMGGYAGSADFELTGNGAGLHFYESVDLSEGASVTLRNGAGVVMFNGLLSLDGAVLDVAGVSNSVSADGGLKIQNAATALHFDISGDNLYDYESKSTANAILNVTGEVEHTGYTLHVDAAGLVDGQTYVLMTCDKSFACDGINVIGAASADDLTWWNDNTTLVYTHHAKEYEWMNGTGSGEWNKQDANWQLANSSSALVYGDGVKVIFNDKCTDASAITLVQDVAPDDILVEADRDYTFTSAGGKITGDTGITKNGSGTLELRLDNDFTGNVFLNEGTLVAAADHALGSGILTVHDSATLEVAGLGTHVTTLGSSIAGGLKVNQGASLSVEAPVQFSAAALQVDGALHLSTAAQDAQADSLSGAGQMYVTGGGSVSLGALSAESREFSGTLSVTGAHVTVQNADAITNGAIKLHGAEASLALRSTQNVSLLQQASLYMENGACVQLPDAAGSGKGTLLLQGATLSVVGSGNVVDGNLKFSSSENQPVTLNFTLTGNETTPLLHADSLDWKKGVLATINIDLADDSTSGRYVLLDLDSSLSVNYVTDLPECWSAVFVTVTGDACFTDLEWVSNGDAGFTQLVLEASPINGLVWNNASGSKQWNRTDANWRNDSGEDVTYFNDQTIYFLDYKGPERVIPLDAEDYTVYLHPGDGETPNVYRPQKIVVDTEKIYEFADQYANVTGGAIVGAELIKKGNGTLALYAANNVFSGIQLLEGTLEVGFDGSVDIEPGESGTGCFTTAAGTNLNIVRNADVDIKADGSSIRGGVSVDVSSDLIYSASYGYWAEKTNVEGELTFSGDFLSSRDVILGVSAGELSGSGSVKLAAARDGALAYFARNNGFTGDLTADNAGTLMFAEGGYSSESGHLVAKNAAQIVFRDQAVSLTGSSGISLQQGATFETGVLNIESGASLAASGAQNVLQTNGFSLENGAVVLQFGTDNLYTEGSNNAVLTVNGRWIISGNNTFAFSIAPEEDEIGSAYYLLALDNEFDVTMWNAETVSVEGVAFSDLKWIDGNTKLIYQRSAHELIWMNSAGTQKWNLSDYNWVQEGSASNLRFYNGDSVHFTDDSPASAQTVILDAPVAPENIYVESDVNNFVFTGNGKLTGEMTLHKTGESTLTIATDNDFTGTVLLQEGKICLHADDALGGAALQSESGTTLSVGNAANVHLNAAGSQINGDVVVDAEAELRIGNAVAWNSNLTEVNGTLRFDGDFSAVQVVSESVSGNGTIMHAGTAERVAENVITIRDFADDTPQLNFTAANGGIIHFDLMLDAGFGITEDYVGDGVFEASAGGILRFSSDFRLGNGSLYLTDGGIIEAYVIHSENSYAHIAGVDNHVKAGMEFKFVTFEIGQANMYTGNADVAALHVDGKYNGEDSYYFITLTEAVASGSQLLMLNLNGAGAGDEDGMHLPENCKWIEDGKKLVYVQPNQDLVWRNASASGIWNHDDANWQVEGYRNAISFTDGDRVFFTDACTDGGDVQISGEVAPAHIEVNAESRDYVFSGNGKITGATSLVKKGAGSLALATDNDFSGGVDLQQGTLRLQADRALGNSALKTESGTKLVVENAAAVALNFAAADAPLKSDIEVAVGASLTLGGSYTASSAVSLSGNGQFRFAAENGQILFSSVDEFGGDLVLSAARSSVTVTAAYSGTAALRVIGEDAQLLFEGAVRLENGGVLQVGENGVFGIDADAVGLEIAAGATLHAGAADIERGVSLALDEVACPGLAVSELVLQGGSTYVQDGTYFTLSGDDDSLAFNGNGVIFLETSLDYTVTEDGFHRFILFDGVEQNITLSDSVAFSVVGYEGLETNVVQVGSAVYVQVVPEPATATLSLLALVALAARRRRR